MNSIAGNQFSVRSNEKAFGVRELIAGESAPRQGGNNWKRVPRYPDGLAGKGAPRVAAGDLLPVLSLLVVDDDDSVRGACAEIGRQMGFNVLQASDRMAATRILTDQKIDLVLADGSVRVRDGRDGLDSQDTGDDRDDMESGDFVELQQVAKQQNPEVTLVVMSATATVSSAVKTMRAGAVDLLTKPFALDELVRVLERAALRSQVNVESRRTRERLRSQRAGGPLIGESAEMEKLYRILSKVAHSSHPVLICGESGTGKELVARSIHFHGANAARRFVPVDCGSLAPERIEGELFGYAGDRTPGGSFAGGKDGLLVSADGGTIFLDEISELSLDVQAKLSRALQERTVRPLGGQHGVPMAARVLAASHRDLAALVEQGKFRKDLYFRLNIVNLRIPALRDRKDDISLLAQSFLERIRREKGIAHTFSNEVLRVLELYSWPGNVRELESVVEHACALSSGPVLHLSDLPHELQGLRQPLMMPAAAAEEATLAEGGIVPIAELEKQAIVTTIRQLNGDKLMAARLLGIGKTTLYRKLKEYGLAETA